MEVFNNQVETKTRLKIRYQSSITTTMNLFPHKTSEASNNIRAHPFLQNWRFPTSHGPATTRKDFSVASGNLSGLQFVWICVVLLEMHPQFSRFQVIETSHGASPGQRRIYYLLMSLKWPMGIILSYAWQSQQHLRSVKPKVIANYEISRSPNAIKSQRYTWIVSMRRTRIIQQNLMTKAFVLDTHKCILNYGGLVGTIKPIRDHGARLGIKFALSMLRKCTSFPISQVQLEPDCQLQVDNSLRNLKMSPVVG